MKLKEWSKIFIKHKDINKKEIKSINIISQGLKVERKNGEKYCVKVADELDLEILEKNNNKNKQHDNNNKKESENKCLMIICLNTKKNVSTLTKIWEKAKKIKDLTIIFANPKTNERWMIKPHIHEKISGEGPIETGLKSIFSSITEV